MNKIILFVAVLIAFTSCGKTSSKEIISEESQPQEVKVTEKRIDPTTELLNFIESYIYKERGVNDIVKKELLQEREKKVAEYVDSFLVFKNFKGIISEIKQWDNNKNSIKITYKIEIPFIQDKYSSIFFYCENIIENSKQNSDYLYNTIKYIPQNSEVHFDGFIAMDRNKTMPRIKSMGKDFVFSFPCYYFHVLDISSVNQLPDTISSNLKKTMLLGQKECKHIVKKWKKEKTSSKDYETIYANLKKLKENLTQQELEYYERYTDAYTDDLVKSGR